MKYVIQVTRDDGVTAKVHLVTAFIPRVTDGSAEYPWFVEGNDLLFKVHQGTVIGEQRGEYGPWI